MSGNRWLLPEGVEEFLPAEAQGVESLRRQLIDIYARWGYELIMPPLLEFTDSLLSGVGQDLNLATLKVTDQLTGRMMGLRADMTPQAARIDAHSYVRQGVSRLCYADHVLLAKPKSPLKVRTPLQTGIELFGEAGLDADIEVISLLLDSLNKIGLGTLTLDLGHVGIFRALCDDAALNESQQNELLKLLQTKDQIDIDAWVNAQSIDADKAAWFTKLADLRGDLSILEETQVVLKDASDEVHAAIDELAAVSHVIETRFPQVNLYFDLGELRGYNYHTGIVFAAYTRGFGDAIANGGRYDHVGEAFGRSRPATGFGMNLTAAVSLLTLSQPEQGIFAPSSNDPAQWLEVQKLRDQGERVVSGLSDDSLDLSELNCDRKLSFVDGIYQVLPL